VPVAVGHILFVCTGNTGRSVAAKAFARRAIAARGLSVTVCSRGVAVDPANVRPEPHLAMLLAVYGMDLSGHCAAVLTADDVRAADCILVMTAAHKRSVLGRFPDAGGKVWMLSEVAHGTEADVEDAFGSPICVYERLVEQLDTMVASALDTLNMA